MIAEEGFANTKNKEKKQQQLSEGVEKKSERCSQEDAERKDKVKKTEKKNEGRSWNVREKKKTARNTQLI